MSNGLLYREFGNRAYRAVRTRFQFGAVMVVLELPPANILAVREYLPRATHVFDQFHVVKLLNEQLSELLRELYREAATKLEKDVLKGACWLLLKNSEHLDDTRQEARRLEEALELNDSLAAAYYLKETCGSYGNSGPPSPQTCSSTADAPRPKLPASASCNSSPRRCNFTSPPAHWKARTPKSVSPNANLTVIGI